MKKTFCDSCAVQLTPDNWGSRAPEITWTSPGGYTFRGTLSWGSDVSRKGEAIVMSDGDLCAPCLSKFIKEGIIE